MKKESNRTRYGTIWFYVDGLDDNSFVDADGDLWKADEYGDRFICGIICNGINSK